MKTFALALLLLTSTSTSAFATTPPPSELVLVPLSVADAPGANGSLWTTELWMTNVAGFEANIEAYPCVVDLVVGCRDRILLQPGQTRRLGPFGTPERPGVLLRVNNALPEGYTFNLNVRDRSRQSEQFGVEIPVVRHRDFRVSWFSLTNIPFGNDYRLTLRVYGILSTSGSIPLRVSLYAIDPNGTDRLLRRDVVNLTTGPVPPPNMIASPLAQITLTDLFQIEPAGVERVRVTVEIEPDPLALRPPIPLWGFVSVTNNRTQLVTVVTPR